MNWFTCIVSFLTCTLSLNALAEDPVVRQAQFTKVLDGEREVIEIRLTVDPFTETTMAPYLYVGDTELIGFTIQRQAQQYLLAFYADPADLQDGDCITLTYDHGEPLANPPEICDLAFAQKDLTEGVPLDPKVERNPDSLGPPPVSSWAGPSFAQAETVTGGAADFSDVTATFIDPQGNPIEVLEPGDTLAVSLSGLPSREQIEIEVVDETGARWSFARLSADRAGTIPETLLWYNTGVYGHTTRDLGWTPEQGFRTFEEAAAFWAEHTASIRLSRVGGELLQELPLPMAENRSRPLLYPSNSEGVLMNAINVEHDVFVTGTDFPAGATIMLFAADNRYDWQVGDVLNDVSGPGFGSAITTVRLDRGQTRFTVPVWSGLVPTGSYDFVARVVETLPEAMDQTRYTIEAEDVVSFGLDTALNLYRIRSGHLAFDLAGREKTALNWSVNSWFEFSDVFNRLETVYGAVDPTDFPAVHNGGQYASFYVVNHHTGLYWDSLFPVLTDISGPNGSSQPETAQVKYGCINVTRTAIWPNADPPTPGINHYDVVVHFGNTTGTVAYNMGNDFIDGYDSGNGNVGFSVIDEASTPGPFAGTIGRANYYKDTFTGGDNEPWSWTYPFPSGDYSLVRNWFTMRYPAQSQGNCSVYNGTSSLSCPPLPQGSATYPVVIILHGRHPVCTTPGMALDNHNCLPANRIASHQGYDYLLDMFASQGYIAISIDAFDIQSANGVHEYTTRGRLILEHLNRLREWTTNGTDPFPGVNFLSRIDMNKVTIIGHSRGGEGAAAAVALNNSSPFLHDIGSVIALAPTQQGYQNYDLEDAPYLLLQGTADGDIKTFQGIQTYDRAYPAGGVTQHAKSFAWIYGANHNFFNTVWTPYPGNPDPYAVDDGPPPPPPFAWPLVPRLTVAEQRQVASTTIAGWAALHTRNQTPYREIFTGLLQPTAIPNNMIHWSYQDPTRMTVDDFQDGNGLYTNSLGGMAQPVSTGLFGAGEGDLGDCSYHDSTNDSLYMNWANNLGYRTELPVGSRNVSAYTHLSFRVMQMHDGYNQNPGGSKNIAVTLIDSGNDSRTVQTSDFRTIPYPYLRDLSNPSWPFLYPLHLPHNYPYPCALKTIRIPLHTFTMNNSGVNLTNIRTIELDFTTTTGIIGLDDIQFTR